MFERIYILYRHRFAYIVVNYTSHPHSKYNIKHLFIYGNRHSDKPKLDIVHAIATHLHMNKRQNPMNFRTMCVRIAYV